MVLIERFLEASARGDEGRARASVTDDFTFFGRHPTDGEWTSAASSAPTRLDDVRALPGGFAEVPAEEHALLFGGPLLDGDQVVYGKLAGGPAAGVWVGVVIATGAGRLRRFFDPAPLRAVLCASERTQGTSTMSAGMSSEAQEVE